MAPRWNTTTRVFRRVALHVLREIEDSPIALVRSALLDRDVAENPHFHHEYLLLAAERFADLSGEERSTIAEFRELARRAGLEVIAAEMQGRAGFVVQCRP